VPKKAKKRKFGDFAIILRRLDKDILKKLLSQYGFEIVQTLNDWRSLHLENFFTLLRLKHWYLFARWLGIHLFPFKKYFYPSKIVVAQSKG